MMLYKLKSELARNRYFGRIRNSAMEMPRGWKRTVFVWGGGNGCPLASRPAAL